MFKAASEIEDCLNALEVINSTHLAVHTCIFDSTSPNSHTDYEMASHGIGAALFDLTKKMRSLCDKMYEEARTNEP